MIGTNWVLPWRACKNLLEAVRWDLRRSPISDNSHPLPSQFDSLIPSCGMKHLPFKLSYTPNARIPGHIQYPNRGNKDIRSDRLLFPGNRVPGSYTVHLRSGIPFCRDDCVVERDVPVEIVLLGEANPVCLNGGLEAV